MITKILAATAPEGGEQPNPLIPADYDIIWSSVIFVILLTFFWLKVLPGFKSMLDERAKAIEGRLAEAEEAQKAAEHRTALVMAEQEKLRRGFQYPRGCSKRGCSDSCRAQGAGRSGCRKAYREHQELPVCRT